MCVCGGGAYVGVAFLHTKLDGVCPPVCHRERERATPAARLTAGTPGPQEWGDQANGGCRLFWEPVRKEGLFCAVPPRLPFLLHQL